MTEILPRPMVLEEFSPLVGKNFTADTQPSSVELTLVEASPFRQSGLPDRPPFILIFHTPPEIRLLDGNYVLKCGDWGPDIIHMWATNAPSDGAPGFYYQAVFN